MACRYCATEPYVFLMHAAAAAGSAQMEVALSRAAFAYLWDHRVAGRALFPAAAMLEAASAAAAALLAGSRAAAGQLLGGGTALALASIPAPLVLPHAWSQAAASVLSLGVDTKSGALSVGSATAGRPRQVHLRAAATCSVHDAASSATLGGSLAAQRAIGQLVSGQVVRSMLDGTPPAVAVASVANQRRHEQGAQYRTHPAVIDSCTQAGAAFAGPGSPGSHTQVTRVPAGLDMFSCGAGSVPQLHASAAFVGLLPDGSALSDYSLSGSEGGCAMAIQGMLFKPVSGVAAAHAQQSVAQAAALGSAVSDALYETSWVAERPCPACNTKRRSTSRLLLWTAGTASGGASRAVSLGDRHSRDCSTMTAVSSSLRYVQAHSLPSTGAGQTVLLSSVQIASLSQPSRMGKCSSAMAAAAAAGMLRVAAQEYPETAWRHLMRHASVARPPSDPAGDHLDAFGSSSSDSAWLSPRLQHAAAKFGTPEPTGLANQSAIVTGGLGNIGSLVAAALTLRDACAHVFLVGRSGRSSEALPTVLIAGQGLVSVLRCDASQQGEVAALAAAVRGSGAPLGAVMHAGGVVQDAPLPKQACYCLFCQLQDLVHLS